MTADDRLGAIRAKVERARTHLDNLEILRDVFRKDEPYLRKSKRDPNTGKDLFYLTNIKIDPAIGLTAGDVIHNLRSALDHLAYQLVLCGGGVPGPHTYFPISDSATVYNNTFAGKVKGMAQDAKDKISAAKPYKGGTDDLWELHRLDIADKHHALLVAPAKLSDVSFPGPTIRGLREFKAPRGISFPDFGAPLKDGDVFFECEPGADKDMKFVFDIALADAHVRQGSPLLKLLQQYIDIVDGLIESFRPELG